MIKKYSYGTPFPTDAVVLELESSKEPLPFFETDGAGTFTYSLSEEDIVYGLGEQIRGINKRGWQYISWNSDNPNHQEDTRSLYGAHNFMIICGAVLFGVFFDYAGKMEFDIGYTKRTVMQIKAEKNDLAVYIITGKTEKEIVKQFRTLIGKSYIPPFWAFGYGQSRWGYKTEQDIRTVAEQYQTAGIPLDSIYLDIDYMERYKDFTVDPERFPDLKNLVQDMQKQGIHLVPIIDAGVKIETGYDVYEEGVQNNYFCKNADGEDFVGAVWPGRVHFPDFLQPEARDWFGKKYAVLTNLGIEGFWNDMNEPAIFYTEDRLADTCAEIQKLASKNMGTQDYFAFTGMVAGLNGNKGDYDKFYHNVNGQMIRHREIHNLYGMNMTRSAFEALQEICPEKRTLFFSRSSYIGAHRYGGVCRILPVKPKSACSMACCEGMAKSATSSVISPVSSPLSVAKPKGSSARYVLSASSRYSMSRAACPTAIGSTPAAAGSSVPAWPTRFMCSTLRTAPMTSCEDMPGGLRMLRNPSIISPPGNGRRGSPSRWPRRSCAWHPRMASRACSRPRACGRRRRIARQLR